MRGETVWTFETKNFAVCLQIEPEDSDPADSFDFADDIEAVRSGAVAWFCARVVVLYKGREVGSDSLGGCAYKTVREFYTSHWDSPYAGRNTLELKARKTCICHYFPSMVAEAIADARKTLCDTPKLRCR